ncbi:MFS transporter [Oceanibium sediminis]|uniref:MFS transporter n=1 Tax=Oceanibium sediminis TaxID=2026339 RepID=UPI000DD3240F|nr:MFS transporter [Oceanibium sediminis]
MRPIFASRIVTLEQAAELPRWQQPESLLMLFAFGMPLSFAVWVATLQNFVIEVAAFDGSDWGWLQTVREIPGFLAIGVILVIMVMREQTLALLSLVLLGGAVAVTGYLPSFSGLLLTTVISSIGFHYYETVNQSLQLQWIDKKRAPRVLGNLLAMGSAGSLLAYGLIVMTWKSFDLSYEFVFMAGGLTTVAVAVFARLAYPQFEAPNPQIKRMILRRRYWLYYALQFMAGARRQIFIVFAAFMMVERFGFEVHEVTALFLINYVANMVLAPLIGRAVGVWGERRALMVEYVGLTLVFLAYGGIYYFGWGVVLAAALYVIDHLFFAMALAIKTYFQKIADPGDIAPTAAVAFTINHIAAVFLPALLGYVWLVSPGLVFATAAGMAMVSLCLAMLIPRHPGPGHETVFTRRIAAVAE